MPVPASMRHMPDWPHALVVLPARALSAVHRRRRCQLCRSRMSSKTYGRHSGRRPATETLFLRGYTDWRGHSRTRVRYLCDRCRERNDEAGATVRERSDRTLAAAVRRYTAWLHEAPVLTRLPDAVGTFDDPGPEPFVEILDPATVADQFARHAYRHERWLHLNVYHPRYSTAKRMPKTYQDMAMRILTVPGSQDTWVWTGSVFRLQDGRIALHWHTHWEDRVD